MKNWRHFREMTEPTSQPSPMTFWNKNVLKYVGKVRLRRPRVIELKMVDSLVERLNLPDFNHEKYVRELSQKCVGGQELQQQRKTIQALLESTNVMLKKNVYRNYMQFIETAKEINHLESEMYQLSHLLSEQKSLLEVLGNSNNLENSSSNDLNDKFLKQCEDYEKEKQKQEEDRVRILTSILEKVEGCTGLLEVKDCCLLHEGDLLELDPVENSVLQKTHAYLFSDSLMLTSWITNRKGPQKYKMYAMYNLSSMAVVNVRDAKPIEKAFKILAYPDTRLFQCTSVDDKKEWLECFEQAKKTKLANEKVKQEMNTQNGAEALVKIQSIDSPTSIFMDDDAMFSNKHMPEWFLESPEEMDVLMAERHFEDALELLINSRKYCDGISEGERDSAFLDIEYLLNCCRNKIEIRRKNLTEVLMKELEVSSEKSLQGGLRVARRAVKLLIALNKTTQACELMLRLSTSILKKELKCVRREGVTVLYIKQLGNLFYTTLVNIVGEFQRVFPTSSACSAALVVWSNSELTHFMAHVIKQIFVPQSSITTISECVSLLREQNAQLQKFGLDLQYQMDGMLQKHIMVALQDAKDKLIEAIKHRSGEEKWHPTNLKNKTNLKNLIQEMSDMGLTSVHDFAKGDCWFELTSNTVAFTKSYMTLFEDCLRLYSPQLHFPIEEILYEIFHIELRTFQNALRTKKQDEELRLIDKNLKFLIDNLLDAVEKKFRRDTTVPSAKLSSLTSEFNHLKLNVLKPKPAPRSITKYSSEEFI